MTTSAPSPPSRPAPVDLAALARRLGRRLAGAALVTYGLTHLLVWPGAPVGTGGERLRWNGESWLPGWVPRAVVESCGGLLLGVAVLGCVAGGAGMLGLPGARRIRLPATAAAAGCSLALFGLAWPGLEPEPAEFAAGPVLSGMLLAALVATGLLRRRAARRAGQGALGIIGSANRAAAGSSGQAGQTSLGGRPADQRPGRRRWLRRRRASGQAGERLGESPEDGADGARSAGVPKGRPPAGEASPPASPPPASAQPSPWGRFQRLPRILRLPRFSGARRPHRSPHRLTSRFGLRMPRRMAGWRRPATAFRRPAGRRPRKSRPS